MALHRGIDGAEPLRPDPIGRLGGTEEVRRAERTLVTIGTLACPLCDAPVVPAGPAVPTDLLICPFCHHDAPLRDFLSLEAPARPARVEVRVVQGTRDRQRHS